jgi:hypothetical protein
MKASQIAAAAARLANKGQAPPRTELESLSRQAQTAAEKIANDEPLVNTFAASHGDYVAPGKLGDARHARLNRGGTPIARWRTDGRLNDPEWAAIQYCIRLWDRAGRNKITQDYLQAVGQPPASGLAQQEALDELAKFKGRIPFKHWQVFENVCRFDMPAGEAGSTIATNRRSSIDAAHVCVCFVANLIAMWKRL